MVAHSCTYGEVWFQIKQEYLTTIDMDPTSDIFMAPMDPFRELDSCKKKQLGRNSSYAFVASAQRQVVNY